MVSLTLCANTFLHLCGSESPWRRKGEVPLTGRPRSPRGRPVLLQLPESPEEGVGVGGHLRLGRSSDSGLHGTSILRALVTGPLDTLVTLWAPPGSRVGTVTQLLCLGLSIWLGAQGEDTQQREEGVMVWGPEEGPHGRGGAAAAGRGGRGGGGGCCSSLLWVPRAKSGEKERSRSRFGPETNLGYRWNSEPAMDCQ